MHSLREIRFRGVPSLTKFINFLRDTVPRSVAIHEQCADAPRAFFSSKAGLTFRLMFLLAFGLSSATHAAILWSEKDARVVHATGDGVDILGGAAKRDNSASDTLYFKFHVNPLSDISSEEYYAAFQLYEGNEPRLAVGNAPAAWGYSAFYTAETGPSNQVAGDFDLRSARPEPAGMGEFRPYELPTHDHERTIVFKVQYIPGGDDVVTVWLSPNLTRGATVENQPEILTTKFKANAAFNQIRLRHVGGGNGWIFGDMAVATSLNDFIIQHFWQTWWFKALVVLVLLAGVAGGVRIAERKRFQRALQQSEQERVLQRERARIAQDLHDDLGSSLTRISLLSDLARADQDDAAQMEVHLEKISQSAAQTVRALEEIVWAVRPGSDSLQSLVEYIAHFANELFESDAIRCRLDLPGDLPGVPLPPEVRHNIFLVVKEALTNVLRHSGAKQVSVQARVNGAVMEFEIKDDGRGFDPGAPLHERHNGLGNMRRRAEAIGGKLTQESAPGQGTTIRLTVKLPTM